MAGLLSKRIKQDKFESPYQEAMLNLLVAAAQMRQKFDEVCERFGITGTQYNVLRILKGAYPNGYPRAEVICRMIERAPDVTRLIDRLEDQGFVERERSADDRRLSIARITQKGIDLLKEMEPGVRQGNLYLESRLSEKDCHVLSEICEQIYKEES